MLDHLTQYFTDPHVWAFMAAVPSILVGFAGTVLPVLPGTVLMYCGFLAYGLITDFDRLGLFFFLGQMALVGVSYLIDFLASAFGVRIYGGSRAAIWGALLGSLLVFIIGPAGLLIGPLAGAVAGELLMGEEVRKALNAGVGTFVGLVGGTVAKLLVAVIMAAWFIWQVLFP